MIVCNVCGHQNDDDRTFCERCETFLEFSGERIDEELPPAGPDEVDDPAASGFLDRVKAAVGLHETTPAVSEPEPAPDGADEDGRVAEPAAGQDLTTSSSDDDARPDGSDDRSGAGPEDQHLGAMKPGPDWKRHVSSTKATPRRPVRPGDLICGNCGVGNDPTRKFCHRCAHTLAEATVVKNPWWRRLVPRRTKKTVAAGDRPGRKEAHGPGTATRARRAGRRLRLVVLAALAVVVALAAFGPLREPVQERYESLKRRVIPEYEQVSPSSAEATSSAPGHGPEKAIDRIKNTYWAEGAEGLGQGEVLTIHFEEPTDLAKVGLHIGSSEKAEDFVAQPRPRVLSIVAVGETASRTEIELEDLAGFQDFGLDASDVTRLEITIDEVYPALDGSETAIAEIELYRRR